VTARTPLPGRAMLQVALDLLREARSRKWFLGLAIAVSLFLLALSLSLKLEVVDGALAASRLFGHLLTPHETIRSAQVALRPVFIVSNYLTFYGGMVFGVLACADFAPSLLSPGRIEHLLSLPVRRWELLAGTFLGVLVLAGSASLYGAGGLAVILGAKTGVWTVKPLLAALLTSWCFATVYAAMLATAFFVRSAALSAGVGALVFVGGVLSSYRHDLEPMFEEGASRSAFRAVTLLFPHLASVADAASRMAGEHTLDGAQLGRLLLGLGLFTLSALSVGAWRFEQRDF
jgi:hypothetical protein